MNLTQVESIAKATPEICGAPLRVAYDARSLVSGDGGTGKGVQLRNLIDSRWAQFQGYAPSPGKQRLTPGVVQGGSRRYLIWQQLSLPRLLREWKPDVFLAPYNTAPLWLPRGVQLVLVLHDLILMQNFKASTAKAKFLNGYRRLLIPPSVARSTHVLTVSEFSRNCILESFPETRVTVIPCTIPESWFAEPQDLEQRDNYLLLVTAPATHKNAERALRAYATYVRMAGATAANLRVVGLSAARGQFRSLAQELGTKAKVTFEHFVSAPILQQLYRRAKAVLVPSLMEGFGIPVLEAMASGTPVIASRSSSLPEVGGEALHYFDPYDEQSMAASILEVMANPALALEKVGKGQMQAAKFHPAVVRRQIDEFWFQIASNQNPLENRRGFFARPITPSIHHYFRVAHDTHVENAKQSNCPGVQQPAKQMAEPRLL
jgi:glycosyltransferase involved in cell wall biosynthesis